ncbi:hypothetical protein OG292_19465 [Streptomyces sp. NBC_01511]|uniref:hypothetical protein n=1 Tax=Streptomyces sp. NBC_01511 TaxID=2903889 RepID=UPI00387087BB
MTPDSPQQPEASLEALEITEAECRRCGTLIAGLDGRYACPVCGWVNHWSEGHGALPAGSDDPDASNRLS